MGGSPLCYYRDDYGNILELHFSYIFVFVFSTSSEMMPNVLKGKKKNRAEEEIVNGRDPLLDNNSREEKKRRRRVRCPFYYETTKQKKIYKLVKICTNGGS
jgi:hypothetical protein